MLKNTFTKNSEIDWMFDLDLIQDTSERAYLKNMAINSVLDFVGRTMSTAKIKFRQDKETVKTDWDYILNVRPNKSRSAGEFWHKFFYKLMMDNEILIILSDDNQLLIADDFYKETYAVYEDKFKGVIVNDYEFKRSFTMDEVIYLQYNNDQLSKITDGLFKDYGELMGRMLEVAMRNNQIRAGVSVPSKGSANDEGKTTQRLQNFINKIYKSFKSSSVAIVPRMNGFEYEEYTNKMGVSNQSLEDITKMKKSLIDDVSRAVGVPSALVHGEMADLDSNMKAFKRLCISPLVKKLQDELNAKLLTTTQYKDGVRIQVTGILIPDMFDMATNIDKIIGSGVLSPNDVLEDFGKERVDDPLMDKHYVTKNYSDREDELKGESDNSGSMGVD